MLTHNIFDAVSLMKTKFGSMQSSKKIKCYCNRPKF